MSGLELLLIGLAALIGSAVTAIAGLGGGKGEAAVRHALFPLRDVPHQDRVVVRGGCQRGHAGGHHRILGHRLLCARRPGQLPDDAGDPARSLNAAAVGHSYQYGFGVVDAGAAVAAARTWATYGPERVLASKTYANRALPDFGGAGETWVASTEATGFAGHGDFVVEHVAAVKPSEALVLTRDWSAGRAAATAAVARRQRFWLGGGAMDKK